jgi:hypothetical protein
MGVAYLLMARSWYEVNFAILTINWTAPSNNIQRYSDVFPANELPSKAELCLTLLVEPKLRINMVEVMKKVSKSQRIQKVHVKYKVQTKFVEKEEICNQSPHL